MSIDHNQSVLYPSVLLIEDDAGHAMLIKRALKESVSTIEHSESLSEALEKASQLELDLVITDLNLPDTHGVKHVEKLCATFPLVPVLVLTSSTSLSDAVEAMKLGAKDFIVKEFGRDFGEVLGLALRRVYVAEQLEQERRKLEREMAVLKIAIENAQDGLAVVTENGEVRYANRSYEDFAQLCGGEGSQLISICTPSLQKHEMLKNNIKTNLESLGHGAVWNTEIAFEEDKEKAFDLSLSVIVKSDETKSELDRDCVVWVRDTSEQKRRERFQREMLSTTTHDLKGPLGAIITGADILQDSDDKRSSEIALRISSAAHGVVNLIDEFLSARRIKEGNFILHPREYELSELIEDVKQTHETIAQARSIDLSFSAPEGSTKIVIDKLGFSRVLGNILSNSLKFTPKEGKVAVSFDCDPGGLSVAISDTGSGMEPSEAKKIFDRFSRLAKHDAVAGTGLGLFVVKCIVEAHGGSIDVISAVGEGTTFRVYFPAEPPVNERGELISLEFA